MITTDSHLFRVNYTCIQEKRRRLSRNGSERCVVARREPLWRNSNKKLDPRDHEWSVIGVLLLSINKPPESLLDFTVGATCRSHGQWFLKRTHRPTLTRTRNDGIMSEPHFPVHLFHIKGAKSPRLGRLGRLCRRKGEHALMIFTKTRRGLCLV